MLSSIYGFYQRHKRKILFTGVIAGGTYAAVRYASWKFDEWRNSKIDDISNESKRQFHFENNQRTCTMTYLQFLPNVRNVIIEKIDIESLLELLKSKPSNKLEIWERLKVSSIIQITCSVIVNVLLLVFLKVELNIMGGYLFVKLINNNGDEVKLVDDLQVKYLNNVRYLIETGLAELIDDCTAVVEELMKDIPLNEKLSHDKLNEIISDVISKVKCIRVTEDSTKHPFCKYFTNPHWTIDSFDNNSEYMTMTSQTVDVLQGIDCCHVIDKTLDSGKDQLMQQLKTSFIGTDMLEIQSVAQCTSTNLYKQVDIPLAKVIPLLNHEIHEIYKDGANDFLDIIYAHPLLREFSENIYEAFSKEYS